MGLSSLFHKDSSVLCYIVIAGEVKQHSQLVNKVNSRIAGFFAPIAATLPVYFSQTDRQRGSLCLNLRYIATSRRSAPFPCYSSVLTSSCVVLVSLHRLLQAQCFIFAEAANFTWHSQFNAMDGKTSSILISAVCKAYTGSELLKLAIRKNTQGLG